MVVMCVFGRTLFLRVRVYLLRRDLAKLVRKTGRRSFMVVMSALGRTSFLRACVYTCAAATWRSLFARRVDGCVWSLGVATTCRYGHSWGDGLEPWGCHHMSLWAHMWEVGWGCGQATTWGYGGKRGAASPVSSETNGRYAINGIGEICDERRATPHSHMGKLYMWIWRHICHAPPHWVGVKKVARPLSNNDATENIRTVALIRRSGTRTADARIARAGGGAWLFSDLEMRQDMGFGDWWGSWEMLRCL